MGAGESTVAGTGAGFCTYDGGGVCLKLWRTQRWMGACKWGHGCKRASLDNGASEERMEAWTGGQKRGGKYGA